MAAGESMIQANLVGMSRNLGGRKLLLILGVATTVAVMAAAWMWSRQPSYRILFSNFSDRDGGAIVAALEKMNIPYKYAEGGGAILVPEEHVHDARLKLAAQGLPKGGNVGFELMENQKLGVSQFVEQVNFQRALEGELARSIESLSAVQSARVHLALPKASVFVRDQQKPTASVLLNLQPGRNLDQQQVSAILHLVASSVPELSARQVTIVDQNGNLLSENGNTLATSGLDPGQIRYVQELQQSIARRIESILVPIVGSGNVRAEVTADVDFSRSEQAVESYKPNQTPENMTVRSQQVSESRNGGSDAAGVPGALTNQPPAPASAPIDAAAQTGNATATSSVSTRKDSTINYEVDKTIHYVQQPFGGLKRLSVAVVVNYRKVTDKSGKTSMQPLTEAEKNQITDLVKEAMGYNGERGDTLNVVNSRFIEVEKETIPEPPLWKQPENIQLAKTVGQYLLMAGILLFLYLKLLKPMLKSLTSGFSPPPPATLPEAVAIEGEMLAPEGRRGQVYQDNLARARQLAMQDPRIVASVVKEWVGSNE